tara:strand:- start:488 stop:748 length:261 start_codon:yes stop_codon:yes gene_type:complete
MIFTREQILPQLQENVCELFFKKVNGSIRHMTCTLNQEYLPMLEQAKVALSNESPTNPDLIPVWDLDKQAWRSFKVNTVFFFKIKD